MRVNLANGAPAPLVSRSTAVNSGSSQTRPLLPSVLVPQVLDYLPAYEVTQHRQHIGNALAGTSNVVMPPAWLAAQQDAVSALINPPAPHVDLATELMVLECVGAPPGSLNALCDSLHHNFEYSDSWKLRALACLQAGGKVTAPDQWLSRWRLAVHYALWFGVADVANVLDHLTPPPGQNLAEALTATHSMFFCNSDLSDHFHVLRLLLPFIDLKSADIWRKVARTRLIGDIDGHFLSIWQARVLHCLKQPVTSSEQALVNFKMAVKYALEFGLADVRQTIEHLKPQLKEYQSEAIAAVCDNWNRDVPDARLEILQLLMPQGQMVLAAEKLLADSRAHPELTGFWPNVAPAISLRLPDADVLRVATVAMRVAQEANCPFVFYLLAELIPRLPDDMVAAAHTLMVKSLPGLADSRFVEDLVIGTWGTFRRSEQRAIISSLIQRANAGGSVTPLVQVAHTLSGALHDAVFNLACDKCGSDVDAAELLLACFPTRVAQRTAAVKALRRVVPGPAVASYLTKLIRQMSVTELASVRTLSRQQQAVS